jgi:indolepyruvate ferredoxin oxidoreductase
VTVHGGRLRKPEATAPLGQYLPPVPEPILPEIHERFSLLVAGIGGSGVVTISQTIAVAAYLDGLYSSNLDLTGLSQKYGAVTAHVRIAHEPGALHATRIAAGEADALIGCDLIVAAGDESISKLKRGKTGAVISADLTPTADFARNPNWSVDADELIERLKNALGDKALIVDAQRLSAALMGDPIASNMFMLGAAWQRGLVPIRREAIDRAIELNGVAIDANKQAFEWGRRAGHDPMSVETLVGLDEAGDEPPSLDVLMQRRVAHLTDYRDAAYAARYRELVERVRTAERSASLGEALTTAVARAYHKLLAAKDEWEVARLFAAPEFQESLSREFEGPYQLHFHIGAWPFARLDPASGRMKKGEVGPWAMTAFRMMARLKFLRGTLLDPFRLSGERKLERRLIGEFEADVADLTQRLTPTSHPIAVRVVGAYETIHGYGHVKEANAEEAAKARASALNELKGGRAPVERAA